MATLNIATNPWHPEWNYTIKPKAIRADAVIVEQRLRERSVIAGAHRRVRGVSGSGLERRWRWTAGDAGSAQVAITSGG